MRFATRTQEGATLGLAPLIDVVLLLLIFFVVTTSFTEPRMQLELPGAESATPQPPATLVVSIGADGALQVDGEDADRAALAERLAEASAADGELEIRADRATPHGNVVEVLDAAQKVGLTRIGIATGSAVATDEP